MNKQTIKPIIIEGIKFYPFHYFDYNKCFDKESMVKLNGVTHYQQVNCTEDE